MAQHGRIASLPAGLSLGRLYPNINTQHGLLPLTLLDASLTYLWDLSTAPISGPLTSTSISIHPTSYNKVPSELDGSGRRSVGCPLLTALSVDCVCPGDGLQVVYNGTGMFVAK